MKNYKYLVMLTLYLVAYGICGAQTEEDKKSDTTVENILVIEEKKEGDSVVTINIKNYKIKIGENNSVSISKRDETEETNDEGQTITIGTKKKKKKVQTHVLTGLDLGIANFSPEDNVPDRFEAMSKSIDVHWYLVSQRINIAEVFSFQWGLDINWRNYKFSDDIIFQKQPNTGVYTSYLDSNISYSKNKLMARYVSLPVLLELHTKKTHSWKTFGVAFGASFGQLIGAKQKLISAENGKQKKRANYGFSPQRIDLIAKVTLGRLTVYGNYGLTPMFRSADVDFTTEYRPYSFGIQLLGF